MSFLQTPWTGEQVDALNRFQRLGYVHEFTCSDPHPGLDRTLYATVNGWRCPHCGYMQDWAHIEMLDAKPIESMIRLPCDVLLPPNTIIRKGCDLSVLMAAFKSRADQAPSLNRFNDPNPPKDWVEP